MFEFATVALLGLAVTKLVDLAHHVTEVGRAVRLALAFGVGVGIAWAADYSLLAGWGIGLRAGWMGPVATGLVIGGVAAAWHEVLDVLASYARRSHDEASEIETRITPPRAA